MTNLMAAPVNPLRPDDPSELGWPAMLPLEVAMRSAPVHEICEAYNISQPEWNVLRQNPMFKKAVADAVEVLKEQGMSFKIKAQLQAEELLGQSWRLIHDADTPAAVKADLIKFTTRVAGYEPQKANADVQTVVPFQININLGE